MRIKMMKKIQMRMRLKKLYAEDKDGKTYSMTLDVDMLMKPSKMKNSVAGRIQS